MSTFYEPLSHSAPALPMFPLEFRGDVIHKETIYRVMGLYTSVKTAHDCNLRHFDMIPECDGQTDRQTESIIAIGLIQRSE